MGKVENYVKSLIRDLVGRFFFSESNKVICWRNSLMGQKETEMTKHRVPPQKFGACF